MLGLVLWGVRRHVISSQVVHAVVAECRFSCGVIVFSELDNVTWLGWSVKVKLVGVMGMGITKGICILRFWGL